MFSYNGDNIDKKTDNEKDKEIAELKTRVKILEKENFNLRNGIYFSNNNFSYVEPYDDSYDNLYPTYDSIFPENNTLNFESSFLEEKSGMNFTETQSEKSNDQGNEKQNEDISHQDEENKNKRRKLNNGQPEKENDGSSENEEKEKKRKESLDRNREAARKYRQNQKDNLENLKEKIKILEEVKREKKCIVKELRAEKKALTEQNNYLVGRAQELGWNGEYSFENQKNPFFNEKFMEMMFKLYQLEQPKIQKTVSVWQQGLFSLGSTNIAQEENLLENDFRKKNI